MTQIEDVLLDLAPPVARSNSAAVLRLMWRFGQIGAGGFDKIGIAHGLGQNPLRHGIIEHSIEITLRPRTEPIFSHAARFCAA